MGVLNNDVLHTNAIAAIARRQADAGLSQSSIIIIVTTTTIGGTLCLAALSIWIFYQRRRQRRASIATITHRDSAAMLRNDYPIYQDVRFSMHSSTHQPVTRVNVPLRHETSSSSLPPAFAERYLKKQAYVKETWGSAFPSYPPLPNPSPGFFSPTTPPLPTEPQMAHISSPLPERAADMPMPHEPPVGPHGPDVEGCGIHPETGRMSHESIILARESNDTQPVHPLGDTPSPWSRASTQTSQSPRKYAPTLRSSRSSLSRFRMAMKWMWSQGDQPRRPFSPASHHPSSMLKNQASKPNLAPRKLVKKSAVQNDPTSVDHEKHVSVV